MELQSDYDTCTVYRFRSCSVVVDSSADDIEDVASAASNPNRTTPSAATRLDSSTTDARSHSKMATLVAHLHERTDGWEYSHKDVTADKNPRVPVAIVAEGKAAVAAYLAAHSLANTDIAEYLDVSSQTVAQYISDFQKSER
jgi:DNA-binding NarL/FixJ family response regulator